MGRSFEEECVPAGSHPADACLCAQMASAFPYGFRTQSVTAHLPGSLQAGAAGIHEVPFCFLLQCVIRLLGTVYFSLHLCFLHCYIRLPTLPFSF